MFCTQCGTALEEQHLFCYKCGRSTQPGTPPPPRPQPPFARVMAQKKIAGVCAGVARYLGMDVTLVRVIWLLLFLLAGTGFLAYIVCWIVMPREEPGTTAIQTA